MCDKHFGFANFIKMSFRMFDVFWISLILILISIYLNWQIPFILCRRFINSSAEWRMPVKFWELNSRKCQTLFRMMCVIHSHTHALHKYEIDDIEITNGNWRLSSLKAIWFSGRLRQEIKWPKKASEKYKHTAMTIHLSRTQYAQCVINLIKFIKLPVTFIHANNKMRIINANLCFVVSSAMKWDSCAQKFVQNLWRF